MRPTLIAASLAGLGVALVVAIMIVKRASPPVPLGDAQTTIASQPGRSPGIRVPTADTSPVEKADPAPLAFHWSQVESQDYREYIANLKSTGCPSPTINDIIIAELNALYEPRESPLKAQIAFIQVRQSPDPSLEPGNTKRGFAIRKQLREVEQEKQAIIKELLGVEIPLDPIRAWHPRTYERYESALNTVPQEKRELVRQIQETYWETSDQLNDKYQLRRTPEYLEEYKRINAERKTQLAQVLSPEGAEDFEMRSSGIASRLGTYLSGSGVTPDEFREVFRLKNSVEAPYGGSVRVNMTEAGETPEHLQDKQTVETRIAEILGPERYTAYQLAQDPNFQRFSDLSDRFGVTRENLLQAYQLQQQMAPLRQSAGANPQSAAPSAVDQQQYQTTMRQLLGEPAFNALQRGQNFSIVDQLFLP